MCSRPHDLRILSKLLASILEHMSQEYGREHGWLELQVQLTMQTTGRSMRQGSEGNERPGEFPPCRRTNREASPSTTLCNVAKPALQIATSTRVSPPAWSSERLPLMTCFMRASAMPLVNGIPETPVRCTTRGLSKSRKAAINSGAQSMSNARARPWPQ